MRARAAPLFVLLLLLAAAGRAAAADADVAARAAGLDHGRGRRALPRALRSGRAADPRAPAPRRWPATSAGLAAAPGFAVEVGLLLRGERPAPGWDVHWKRNHEIARLRLHPAAGRAAPPIDGALYRGIFLRQSREGTLTLPLTPPLALPLPFDVGVLVEVGRLHGALCARGGRAAGGRRRRFTARCSPTSGARASRGAGSPSASAAATRSACGATTRARLLPRPSRLADVDAGAGVSRRARRRPRGGRRARGGVAPLVERARLGARLPRRRRLRGDAAGRERSAAGAVRDRDRRHRRPTCRAPSCA